MRPAGPFSPGPVPSSFHIAAASDADCDELAALVNSAYRGDTSRAGWTTEADLLDGQRTDPAALRAQIARPGHVILCLRADTAGPILACVSVHDVDDVRGRGVYFGMLTVRPDLQARGLGRALLDRIEQLARERGARQVTMTVIPLRQTLVAWYERRGFRRTGETRPFPYDQPAFGIPKRPDLTLAVFEKIL